MKKAMFIVPHPDDEVMVGNYLLCNLINSDIYDVKVVICTNGDMYDFEGDIRLNESINGLSKVGLNEKDIIFLGYGDCGFQKAQHIYHGERGTQFSCVDGRCETKGLSSHPEWCFQNKSIHKAMTRHNLKNDLKECIIEYKADVLVCVDCDWHPDHRAVSLLFEECMGEILKENKKYQPLVLKRFSYNGLWEGKPDYFESDNDTFIDYKNIIYTESEEIRLRSMILRGFFTNPLFLMLKEHKTQNGDLYAIKVINSDEVLFRRYTENIALLSNITATSGDVCYLNDFKIWDSDDITVRKADYCTKAWIPSQEDNTRSVMLELPNKMLITEVVLYENCSIYSKILDVEIKLDEIEYSTGEIKHLGEKNSFYFDGIECSKIIITIKSCEGSESGLSEIEVFREKMDISCYLPKEILNSDEKHKIRRNLVVEKYLYKCYVTFRKLFPNKYFYWERIGWNASKMDCIKEWCIICIDRLKYRINNYQ